MSFIIKKTNKLSMFHKKYCKDPQKVYLLDYIGDGMYDVYEERVTIFETVSLVHICSQSYREILFHVEHEDPAYKWYIFDEKPEE